MSNAPGAPAPPKAWRWPLMIVGLILLQMALSLAGLFVALSDRSFAVTPDYHSKAVDWDATRQQARQIADLGWQHELELAEDADVARRRTLSLELLDVAGEPLDGAKVRLRCFNHTTAKDQQRLVLEPLGQGRYATRPRLDRPGLWEFRATVTRGEHTFEIVERRQVAPQP